MRYWAAVGVCWVCWMLVLDVLGFMGVLCVLRGWHALGGNATHLMYTPPLYKLRQSPKLSRSLQGGGGNLVRENFCPEKLSAGENPPQSLKVMGKIAPHFSIVKGKAQGRLSLLRGTPLEEKV